MSFVLEALKMQEAGNDPDAVAARALADIHQRRQRLWVGLAVAVTAVNVVVVLWLLGGPYLTNPAATTQPIAAATAETGPAPAAAAPTAAAASQPPAESIAPAATAQQPPAEAQPPQVRRVTRLALTDLPSEARRRFPGIAFSTHIYADDSDLRAIVANGRRLREGDSIRGLGIEEISATGVLLSFEDYLVEIPITTNWDVP
ncbi:MAG: general secretion pathway protein GspB [Pseudomonadales bacterium]